MSVRLGANNVFAKILPRENETPRSSKSRIPIALWQAVHNPRSLMVKNFDAKKIEKKPFAEAVKSAMIEVKKFLFCFDSILFTIL